MGAQRDGSVIKNTVTLPGDLGLDSHGGLQPLVTPVSGNLTSSGTRHRQGTHSFKLAKHSRHIKF